MISSGPTERAVALAAATAQRLERLSGLLRRREVASALALGFAALLLLPSLPLLREEPHRDGGVFLYVAERVLAGDLPYQDVWDHKPPLVYYLNAAALLLPGSALFGVWLVSVAAVGGALAVGWSVLSRAFGVVPALVASAIWPLMLATNESVNFLETYALPLQFAVLALFLRGERHGARGSTDMAVGALAATLALLRPNLIGVPLAVGLVVLIAHRDRRSWSSLAVRLVRFVVGGLVVLVPVLVYFAAVGALGDLVDQVLSYNLQYSSSGLGARALAPASGWVHLADGGASPMLIGGAAWLVVTYELVRGRVADSAMRPLLAVAAVGLPIEVLFASVSGENYYHYYYAWLPPLAVLVGYAAWRLWAMLPTPESRALLRPWGVALALAFGVTTLGLVADQVRELRDQRLRADTAAYLQRETSPTDAVLMWGAEVGVNWAADRESPVRYAYQYALVTPGYADAEMAAEFIDDLERRPPVVVIDASPASDPSPVDPIPTIALRPGEAATTDRPVDEVRSFLRDRYEAVAEIGKLRWVVYRQRDR